MQSGPNEVTLSVNIVGMILDRVKELIPNDAAFKSSYTQFKLARCANPKIIFNNLGTYLLLPFASAIESQDFDCLFKAIFESKLYLENKAEYEDFVENVIFKPINLFSAEEKQKMARDILTLLQLHVNYYRRKGVELVLNQQVLVTPNDIKRTMGTILGGEASGERR